MYHTVSFGHQTKWCGCDSKKRVRLVRCVESASSIDNVDAHDAWPTLRASASLYPAKVVRWFRKHPVFLLLFFTYNSCCLTSRDMSWSKFSFCRLAFFRQYAILRWKHLLEVPFFFGFALVKLSSTETSLFAVLNQSAWCATMNFRSSVGVRSSKLGGSCGKPVNGRWQSPEPTLSWNSTKALDVDVLGEACEWLGMLPGPGTGTTASTWLEKSCGYLDLLDDKETRLFFDDDDDTGATCTIALAA